MQLPHFAPIQKKEHYEGKNLGEKGQSSCNVKARKPSLPAQLKQHSITAMLLLLQSIYKQPPASKEHTVKTQKGASLKDAYYKEKKKKTRTNNSTKALHHAEMWQESHDTA